MSNEKPTEDQNECPTCGTAIPDDAPQGLCPKCVLGVVAEPTDTRVLTISGLRFEPPPIEEIAEAFPQLEILELIGHGGMGAVYKARQPHLDRIVALKILPHALAQAPEFTERFSREGRLLARLNHPNIVGVFDFGVSESESSYFFLLMEFVDGVNLRQAMRAGRFTPEQALDIVPKVCEALQFAHDEGILHRDIKPENILLDTKGRIKIVDFGIAKMIGEVASSGLTQTAVPGTPQYMAPEQIEHLSKVDHRADIYSLGVVFYEMLTGELPIGRFAPPSERTNVSVEVDEIVFRSLEKEADRRQQSADEVRTEISGVSSLLDKAPISDTESFDPQNRPGLALALSFVSLIFPLILWFTLDLIETHDKTNHLTRWVSTGGILDKIKTMQRDLSDQIVSAEKTGTDLEVINQLKIDQKAFEKQAMFLSIRYRFKESFFFHNYAPLRIALFLSFPLCVIPGTLFAWVQLRRQRKLRQKNGRSAVIIAAILWPILAIFGVFFFLLFKPALAGPEWVKSPGITLGIVLSITVTGWAILRTIKWLNHPLSKSERAAFLDDESKRTIHSISKKRSLLHFFLITYPILLIGIVSITISYTQYNSSLLASLITIIAVFLIFLLFYYFLIKQAYIAKKSPPTSSPKHIYTWVISIFVILSILGGVAFLTLRQANSGALLKNHRGDYAIAIPKIERENEYVTAVFETLRHTPGELKVKVVFNGPKWTGPRKKLSENDGHIIYPGETITWTSSFSYRELTAHQLKKIVFILPDENASNRVYSEIMTIGKSQAINAPFFEDLKRLPLFIRVSKREPKYRAWIEFEFIPLTGNPE